LPPRIKLTDSTTFNSLLFEIECIKNEERFKKVVCCRIWQEIQKLPVAAWSSGQDSGELFKEFGFEAEPVLRTFRTLIDTIYCYVIVSSGEVALPLKYLKFVREQLALEKDFQRHLGPGRGATINNSSPLPLLSG
jgi:hypothetical protein